MADFAVPGYNDGHRAFMQAMLARNTITLEIAQPLIAAISSIHRKEQVGPNSITQADLETYISWTNRALSPLDLEIRSALHQTSRERIYALVNTTSDPMTQLATTYSADEIAFVKKMLDAMFDGANNRGRTEAMCLSSIEVLQLAKKAPRRETQDGAAPNPQPKLTGSETEELMRKLEAEGWLEKSDAGFYTLSPRALMELKSWLIDAYNDPDDDNDQEAARRKKIKTCEACKEIITMGQRCPRRECACRLHDICTENFFRSRRSRSCPFCNTEWDGNHYVGEKAITTSDRYQLGRGRGLGAGRRSGAAAEEDEDGVGDGNEGT